MLKECLDTMHPDDRFPTTTYVYEIKDELWDNMVKYLNSLKINQKFTRRKLLTASYEKYDITQSYYSGNTTMDLYRFYLTKIGIIEYSTKQTYKKLAHIPKSVHIRLIRKILLNESSSPWKEWVVPLHEKLGVTEEELYGGVGEMETQRVVAPL